MAELVIGDLADDEIEIAAALWRACDLTRPWNDAHADARRALAGPSSTILAGRLEGVLKATAMVGVDGRRGWVYYLAVASDCRKLGFGAMMMRAAEQWVTARGLPKLQLMVRADNAAAVGFYQAIGYQPEDLIILSRRLDPPPV